MANWLILHFGVFGSLWVQFDRDRGCTVPSRHPSTPGSNRDWNIHGSSGSVTMKNSSSITGWVHVGATGTLDISNSATVHGQVFSNTIDMKNDAAVSDEGNADFYEEMYGFDYPEGMAGGGSSISITSRRQWFAD